MQAAVKTQWMEATYYIYCTIDALMHYEVIMIYYVCIIILCYFILYFANVTDNTFVLSLHSSKATMSKSYRSLPNIRQMILIPLPAVIFVLA